VSSNLLLSETCKFKLEPSGEQRLILERLVATYNDMVRKCLERALELGMASRKKLQESIYKELRAAYADYPFNIPLIRSSIWTGRRSTAI